MILKNWYWYFHKAVPNHICDKILKLGLSSPSSQAITHGMNKYRNDSFRDLKKDPLTAAEKKILFKKRKNHVVWLEDPLIYKVLQPFVKTANENAGWNFDWDWSERAQFGIYNPTGFYGWHTDSSAHVATNMKQPQTYGKIRKISCILQLSNSKDYEGGDFQFDFRGEDPDIEKRVIMPVPVLRDKGTVLCFPSFVWHRLTPLTKGKRHSLIIWNWGKPFK